MRLPWMTSTVNSTSMEVSRALPLSSPSPCSGVCVAEVEQSAGVGDGQIDGGAFGDLVEVHVAAVVAGVAGARRRLRSGAGRLSRCNRAWDGAGRCSGRGASPGPCGRGYAFGRVEMPADGLTGVLDLDGEVVVEGAVDEAVVADGVVAVEA